MSISETIAKPATSRNVWTVAVVIHAPSNVFFNIELAKFYIDYIYNNVVSKMLISLGSIDNSLVLYIKYFFAVTMSWCYTYLNSKKIITFHLSFMDLERHSEINQIMWVNLGWPNKIVFKHHAQPNIIQNI